MTDTIDNPQGPPAVESGYWTHPLLGYYEGDRQPGSTPVPQRPSPRHEWTGERWVINPQKDALQRISALESEQTQRLTLRALRELYLGLMALANQQANPAFLALKDIDDRIKAERGKLK